MEYDYREYRKDSQAVLREKNSRREKMVTFCPPRDRKKEGREPEKKLEIGNSYGTFEIGDFESSSEKEQGRCSESSGKTGSHIGTQKRSEKRTQGLRICPLKMGLCLLRFCKESVCESACERKERSSTETGSGKNGKQADRESFFDEKSGKA